jgi:predicted Fe-Mo cluster-binding NifX family protein
VRVAIATDQDHVAAQFGCCPMCTIAEVVDGHILDTLVIPNPGCNHEFWADLFFRNRVTHILAGSMGTTAEAVLRGRGITVVLGVHGDVADAVTRLSRGELASRPGTDRIPGACCGATA